MIETGAANFVVANTDLTSSGFGNACAALLEATDVAATLTGSAAAAIEPNIEGRVFEGPTGAELTAGAVKGFCAKMESRFGADGCDLAAGTTNVEVSAATETAGLGKVD